MTISRFIYLLLAGIAAGLLSTTVGLASLVSYPALLAIGIPAINANVTNTAALIFTGLGSSLSSFKELRQYRQLMWRVTVWSLCGGILGSLLLVALPADSFERVVPFLVAMAGVLMLWGKKPDQDTVKVEADGPGSRWLKRIAILGVGLYIGYFGASAGLMMLAILTITLPTSLGVTNALKNFAIFAANLMAVVIYSLTVKIYWLLVIPLGIGFFIGGYIGPMVMKKIPTKILKVIIAIAAWGLSIYLFKRAY
ncbi:sulfite exporter TauE/SafE family protein [Lacticaseibacillus baoqingensis]|uniref:Probable membrane transporter protein n=1 Tax=Lacticaseibacillus baoqingensis TaxID=2486013 RepID=A0ABW4E6M6_9LACO|nr:sulfite exporter TauE/SafE family protein [Lacticaseibacillus baoqingensis]